MPADHSFHLLDQRIHALVTYFQRVQQERMQDVPLLNHALKVEAVQLVCEASALNENSIAEGVLITPWFMSLLRLPLYKQMHDERVGHGFVREFGLASFDFLGAYDKDVGYFETCALFSPMFDFETQDQARDTAQAALQEIREGSPEQVLGASTKPSPQVTSRRGFLMRVGRVGGAP